jgi:hypothetical protein
MSRCNFVDPSTGFTHQEIIEDLQQEIAAQATQIYELTKVRQELLEACKKVLTLWQWVVDAGGAESALPQVTIREFAKMQQEVCGFMQTAIRKAEGRS